MEFAQTVGQSKCKFQINLIHKPTCLPQAILKVMNSNLTFPHDCHYRRHISAGVKHLFGLKIHCGSRDGEGNAGSMCLYDPVMHVLQRGQQVQLFVCPS